MSIFYACALLALFLVAWPWWLGVSIGCLLILDYNLVIRVHGLRTHKNSVAGLVQDCDKWQYSLCSGKQYRARLIKRYSYCSQLVLVLCMRSVGGQRYLLIPCDALSRQNYRFLAMQINN